MMNVKQNLTSYCADICSGHADEEKIIKMIALFKAFHMLYININSPEARQIHYVVDNLKSVYAVYKAREEVVLMPYELHDINQAKQSCLAKSGRRNLKVLQYLYTIYLDYYKNAL